MGERARRVVLKLSGEALGPAEGAGIDLEREGPLFSALAGAARDGIQIALVIGGGNLVRGRSTAGEHVGALCADYMGMLATVINGLALTDSLRRAGAPARLFSALEVRAIAPAFDVAECAAALDAGAIAVLAGGTGNPFFTTDTAAALRARELGADALLKATNVDGAYTADPDRAADARLLRRLTADEFLRRRLGVMDAAAVLLCRDAGIPIVIFNYRRPDDLMRALRGDDVGTRIEG